jgi:cysteine-rich repeat protein
MKNFMIDRLPFSWIVWCQQRRSMLQSIWLFGLLFLVGCPEPPSAPVPPFISVTIVDQPGLVAPIPEVIKFTTSGIVNGNFITKDFEFNAEDHILPTDFVVLFSEGVRGNTVDIEIHAFIGEVEVFTATTAGIAGIDLIEAVARFCGDGTTDQDRAEGCDDGDLNSDTEPNACRTTCQPAGCGDGILDPGEVCDNGVLNSDTAPNACRTSCAPASCGDNVIDDTEECDDGANNSDTLADACRTSCQAPRCGDGIADTGEDCDDANSTNSDGCDNDCIATAVIQVAAGGSHTCVLLRAGDVRCWGLGSSGQLGYGNTNSIGDNELPSSAGNVNIGGTVVQLAAGSDHTCVLLETGKVRCWGRGNNLFGSNGGQLGYGNQNNIGDNELPFNAGDVNVGGTVIQITAGSASTCALLTTGTVRCWGVGVVGNLGYGNTNDIGDNELPSSAGNVNVGGTVIQLTVGSGHTCALLNTSKVRCWGEGNSGQLGYANANNIGDNESPASAGDVNTGGTITQISAGSSHTCALLNTGKVRCWGAGSSNGANGTGGRLGYGNTFNIGDDETPSSVGDVNVGGNLLEIVTGTSHTCALLDSEKVRCWGAASSGQLGYANTNNIGDNELPFVAGNINVGGNTVQITTGGNHTCALLDTGKVRCWGNGANGRLGYGNAFSIGDDETPASAGDVVIF